MGKEVLQTQLEKEGKSAYKRISVIDRAWPTPSSSGKLVENTMRKLQHPLSVNIAVYIIILSAETAKALGYNTP
jgi:hypothetical protein